MADRKMDEDETFRRLMESAGVAPLDPAAGAPGPQKKRSAGKPRQRSPPSEPADDEADRRLFEAAMRELDAVPIDTVPLDIVPIDTVPIDTVPLDTAPAANPRRPPPASPEPRSAEPAGDEAERLLFEAAMRELDAVPIDPALVGDVEAPPEAAPRVPRRIRPRKKDLQVDERLDLHGCTAEQAAKLLQRALPAALRSRSRTLLVITGKGHHSPDGVPVLRRRVEEWIRRHGRRQGVDAYSEAPRALGGRGAFVLYLESRSRS